MKKNNFINEHIPLEYKELLDIMMDSSADAVYFKDKECRFFYVSNTQLERLGETDLKNVIGKTDADFFSKEHAEKAVECEQQIMKTGIPLIDIEENTTWANGKSLWNKVSKYPLYDRDNNIIGTWGISTDITNQKNTEYQLKEEEERYRILSAVTIEGVVIHQQGVVRDLNPSFVKLFGYEREELLGRNLLDLVFQEDKSILQEIILKESGRLCEVRFLRKNGSNFYAEVESRKIQESGTELMMAAVRDITARKMAEEALQESEKRMRAITDSAHDCILMMDQDGIVTYWNPAAERILGYSRDEAIGKNLHELIVPPEYEESYVDVFPMFPEARDGNAGRTLDLKACRKDNTEISVQLSLSTVQLYSGWFTIGILRDVTIQKENELELIKAKEVAEEATGAKSEFLANMSHEIRTPMNAIIGFSGLLKKSELTAKQLDYINKIDNSANSLLGIINDILDFSKIEAGKLELEDVDFRLDDVINNIVSMVSEKAAEKNIELLNNITNDVPCALIGDPLRVGQVLINLVNNAVKFTNKGYILIKTELLQGNASHCKIKFSVQDTGIGMTDEQKSKLFTAFSQADSSVTRRFGGTGLGLTISKQLVEMMNGEMYVESEFGAGSTFTFIVGFRIQDEYKEKKVVEVEGLKNKKALIVDDNEMSRDILKDQIGGFGINSIAVDSGRAAIEEIKRQQYDLVFLDWRMPDMDGLETAKIILKDKSIERMPTIIMLSAFGREEVFKKAEKIGINVFLMKPVSQSLLFDTIMNACHVEMKDIAGRSVQKDEQEDRDCRVDGIKVLLVEDNAINQEVATEILMGAGATVEIANNGREAVDAVAKNSYDVVLMDLQMPVMGGYEATQLIRKDEKYKDLPIIAMTAHAMQGVQTECIAAGMNDYVSKPIDPKHLFNALKKWTRHIRPVPEQQIKEVPKEKEQEKIKLPKSIPGIDIEAGLERLNGNRKLYRKLLIDFFEKYASFAEDIRKELDHGTRETAVRLAHTIKGVAGNISAYGVQEIAAELEAQMSGSRQGKYDVLLKKLEDAIQSVSKLKSELVSPAEAQDSNAERPVNPRDVEHLLQELAHFIWEDNVDAANVLEELRKYICGTRFNNEMRALSESIENFDFDAAKVPLQKIAKELNVFLGE